MATFAELSADNPNIRAQFDEWAPLRAQNGEDPTDYQAFRQHVMALGAPDPARPRSTISSGTTSRQPTRSATASRPDAGTQKGDHK